MTTGMQRHTQHQMTEKEKRYPGSTEPYQKRKFFRETATKGGETRGNLSAAEKQIEQTLKNSIPHKARNGLSLEPLKQAKSEDDVLNFLEGIGAPLTPETLTAAANYWRRGGG
jgi:general stress protein YciG